MADKVSKATSGSKALNVSALKSAVAQINKHKEAASEASGRAGKATSEACETYNFNKKALSLVAFLAKKDAAQQKEVLGAVVSYAAAMGMFDSSDMFDNHVEAMRAVVEAATSGKSAAPAGAAMVATLSGVASPH